MTQASDADDAYFFSWSCLPVMQWLIGRYAGAEQRRNGGEVQVFRNPQYKALVDDDAFGIAAECPCVEDTVVIVIGLDASFDAILFQTFLAILTNPAGVDHTADGGEVALFEFVDVVADAGDPAHDLVPRDNRIDGITPFVARLAQIRMAYATIEDLDPDVVRAREAAGNSESAQWPVGSVCSVGFYVAC